MRDALVPGVCADVGVAANPFWFVYELEWEALSESKPKRTMFRSSLAPPTYISIRCSLPACLLRSGLSYLSSFNLHADGISDIRYIYIYI